MNILNKLFGSPQPKRSEGKSAGTTSLILEAAEAGNAEAIKKLLRKNPDLVFARDNHGWMPLHEAYRHLDVAELLIANKAPVNAKSIDCSTPLNRAAAAGSGDVVKLLLANEAEVNARNGHGMTPLNWAASNGHKEVAELLLAKGAEANVGDNIGRMPLHWAAQNGYVDVVELLLTNRAEINAEDFEGLTPVHLAAARFDPNGEHKKVVEFLRRRGAHLEKSTVRKLNDPRQFREQAHSLVKLDIWQMDAEFLRDYPRVLAMFNVVGRAVGEIRLIDLEFENGVVLQNIRIKDESVITIPSQFVALPVHTLSVPTAERQQAFEPMEEQYRTCK
jgi:hypothetical protein